MLSAPVGAPVLTALPADSGRAEPGQPYYEPGYEGPPRYLGAPRTTGPMPSVTGPARPATGPQPRAATGSFPVADTGPQNYTDDGFGVHLAFFSRTPAVARMRILEGRRRQVEERREGLRDLLGRATRSNDHYTRQMHELSLETSEREVQWLNKLIADEASGSVGTPDFRSSSSETTTQDEVGKNSAAQHSAVPLQQEGDPDHG